MKYQYFALWLLALLGAMSPSAAQTICADAEARLQQTIAAFAKDGPNEFIAELTRGGPLEGDKRLLAQARGLEQINDFFGSVTGHTLVSSRVLGERTCYLHFLVEYENGPAFAVATMYKMKSGVVASTSFFFKTEPETLFPKQLLLERK